ncbi:MAG: hypothetical protein ABH865_01680 [Candidatus Omnitrophota bacterium]
MKKSGFNRRQKITIGIIIALLLLVIIFPPQVIVNAGKKWSGPSWRPIFYVGQVFHDLDRLDGQEARGFKVSEDREFRVELAWSVLFLELFSILLIGGILTRSFKSKNKT